MRLLGVVQLASEELQMILGRYKDLQASQTEFSGGEVTLFVWQISAGERRQIPKKPPEGEPSTAASPQCCCSQSRVPPQGPQQTGML